MFSRPKILFAPCFLTFCSTIEFNPYLPFEFYLFYHSMYIQYGWAVLIFWHTIIVKQKYHDYLSRLLLQLYLC